MGGEAPTDTPNVREAAAIWPTINEFGALHIVVADGNLDDENIRWCLSPQNSSERKLTDDERHFGELLLTMSEAERETLWLIEIREWQLPPQPTCGLSSPPT